LRLPDVQLLALLRATPKQNDELAAVPPEVDAVSGAEINPAFENAAAAAFDVGQVAVRNSSVISRTGSFVKRPRQPTSTMPSIAKYALNRRYRLTK
jgi:hypothetical protein